MDEYRHLDIMWRVQVPRQAKEDPDAFAVANYLNENFLSSGTEDRERVLHAQRATQAALREQAQHIKASSLRDSWTMPSPESDLSDWIALPDSGRVETWRFQSAAVFWHGIRADAGYGQVRAGDTTRADWIEPFVALERVRSDRASFNHFWFEEVDVRNMPRNWLRVALATAQLEYQIGDGNPGDEQQAAYLVDCDLYLTADRRFAMSLEALREAAPFPVAQIRLVDRNSSSPVAAIDALTAGLD
jgi:hypothetical protein